MKYCLIFCCLFSNLTFAQQKPYHTQYILNNYLLNPAISGIENYTDVKLSYRNQWSAVDGAPVTSYFTLHAPIGKSDYTTNATSYSVPGENPRGKSFMENYEAPPAHHGIGVMAITDKAGYLNRWGLYASYAYHQPLSPSLTLSAGLRFGMNSVTVDQSQIKWGDLDPNDPAIGYTSGALKKVMPEAGVGLWLYGRRFFAGASLLNLIPGKINFVKDEKYGVNYQPNLFLTAGYRHFLSENVSLLPSVAVQIIKPQPVQVHTNAKLQYRDLFWLGAGYRFSDMLGGFTALAGVNPGNSINISYSYDMATTSRLRTFAGNTHEIMIGFILGNRFDDSCPRNIW